jgi:hypothetical protein
MARGRMLLKRISMSEKVNKNLSCDTSRLLYTWLLSHLDVNGCYYADPIIVKNTIFPWREDITIDEIEKYLKEMNDCGLIVLYDSGGNYLHYPDFEDKQPKINKDREGRTDIPTPTQDKLKSKSRPIPTQNKVKQSKVKQVNKRNVKSKSGSHSGTGSAVFPSESKHFSKNMGEYLESIKKLCEEIYSKPFKDEKFNPFQFVQFQANKRIHPGAIQEALKGLLNMWDDIDNPFGYGETIIKTKNGNYNEAEFIQEKQDFKNLVYSKEVIEEFGNMFEKIR